jgi:hypothetical protein
MEWETLIDEAMSCFNAADNQNLSISDETRQFLFAEAERLNIAAIGAYQKAFSHSEQLQAA